MIIAARTWTSAGHALAQQLGHLVARAQVLRGRLVAEPAEVDDALDAGVARGLAEVDGRLAVAARRSRRAPAPAHRVDQVVGGAAALERRRRSPVAGDRVALADVDLGGQPPGAGSRTSARTRRPRPQQLVEQVRADVAGGAGQQDGFWIVGAAMASAAGRRRA